MKENIYALTYEAEQKYWWYAGRRKIIHSFAADILNTYSGAGRPRLLDYGCGTGLNLLEFSTLGDVYGADCSPSALNFCRERGLKNLVQVLETCPPETNPFGQPFHLVTLLDVLEHLTDDRLALTRLKSYLAHGGCLLATVPAYQFLWSGEDYVSNHLRRYTMKDLVQILSESGFEVIRATCFNTILFPIQAAKVLWDRTFSPEALVSTNVQPIPDRLNALLTLIFTVESKFLKKRCFPYGGSILCVARVRQS